MTPDQVRGRLANRERGEATLLVAGEPHVLRPSFAALVAAEDELGPLFALVERASAGQLRLDELAALFWHCLAAHEAPTGDRPSRETVAEAVVAGGLAAAAVPLRALLVQILQGRQ